MQIALDITDNRINIIDSIKGQDYFCPVCRENLIQKKEMLMLGISHIKNLQLVIIGMKTMNGVLIGKVCSLNYTEK